MTDTRSPSTSRTQPIRNSLILAMFLLIAVTVLLYVLEYRREERRVVESHYATFAERLSGLETAVDQVVAYVDLAHAWTDSYWESGAQEQLQEYYLGALEYHRDGDYSVLTADAQDGGLVFGVGRPEARGPLVQRDLGLAFSLLPWFRGAKAESEAILLSYFFSDFLLSSSYPPANLDALLAMGGGHLENALSQFYVPHGGMQSNPEHKPYFMDPYVDRAGHGLVVTYSYPVYEGDRFVGVVASDITLGFLQAHASEIEGVTGRLLLVAPDGTVLADSMPIEDPDRSLVNRLPESLRGQWASIGAGEVQGRVGPYYVNSKGLNNAPWVFVQVIEREAIAGLLLSSQITLGIGLLVLTAMFFIAYSAVRRRRLAAALAESELLYEEVFNATSESIFIHDAATGQILGVNSAFETMFGYPRSAARDLSVEGISLGETPYSGAEAAEHIGRAAMGEAPTFEWRSRRSDDTIFWSEVSLLYRKIANQDRVIAVVRDIDQRKSYEAELASYRSELERLVEERTRALAEAQEELVKREKMAVLGQLTATVSHELRNPLGTIANSLFMVNERVGEDGGPAQRAIERAQRSIKRCNDIIGELLDYTRSQQQNRKETPFDLWLAGTVEELGAPFDMEVELRLEAGAIVSIDPEQIRRCVANILENAQQAITPVHPDGGTVLVETLCVDNRLITRFKDNGSGVLPENLEKIFEPLYSTKSFGVGLGLPIVRQIMEAHGGGVSAAMGSDGGAIFELWLPLSRSAAP